MKRIVLLLAVFFLVALIYPADAPAPGDPCIGVVCDDNNLCTEEYCDSATGSCVYETVVVCDDTDLCKEGTCNPATGECDYEYTVCDDDDECTDDSCDSETGECVFKDNGSCEECPPAYPKTQGYWQHQCRALGLIGNSNGRVRLHEEWMAALDNIEEICDNLDADDSNDMCAKAAKQLQALMLNRMSERVADCNCLMPEGTIGDAIDDIEDYIAGGMCKEANDLADAINTGMIIIECKDQEPPKPPTDVIIK